jgi:acyl-CoA thioesterase-2
VSSGIGAILDLLDLEPIEVNIFRGRRFEGARDRVFGGQVAAQALVAAARTVTDCGRMHSLHAYFLRPGDPAAPILYEVDRIRDGRSFATRRVVAIQHGTAIFNLACSYHVEEEGLQHAPVMPAVPRPETLPATAIPEDRPVGTPFRYLDEHGLEIRFVGGPLWARPGASRDREQFWFRVREPLGDDPVVHLAIVTFISDAALISTIVQRHGMSAWTSEYFAASLDHSMWFHRPLRADQWLLFDQASPVAYGALGLTLGSLFDESGALLASVAQEGLVRVKEGL